MFRISNSTLMDRKYPNALAYIKIKAVIWVKQKLSAVKIWAKMIWKQPSSFDKVRSSACIAVYKIFARAVNKRLYLLPWKRLVMKIKQKLRLFKVWKCRKVEMMSKIGLDTL